jgi:hypothetical protein
VKKKMKAEMEIAQKTAGEEFHTLIEESATSELDCLRAKDASFYNDDSRCSNFIYYLMCQFFRTLKMRNLVASFGTPVPGHDLRRTWVIESLIYATNVGFALYAERHRYKIIFLENQSAVPFITGDQPVINLRTHQINHAYRVDTQTY